MQTQPSLKTLGIIHMALIAGQVIFAAVAIGLNGNTAVILQPGDDVFFFVVPAVALFGIVGGSMIYRKMIDSAKEKTNAVERFKAYVSIAIIRYALLEGPSLFAIVAYFLSGNLFYIFVSGLLIVAMVAQRPSREKVAIDLEVRPEELV